MFNDQIFIVDDSRIQLILLEKILEREGYSVRTFTSGYDLVHALKHNFPALIISDIEMPKLNGFQLIEKVRKEINNTTIPFFLMSSKGGLTIQEKAADAGADVFIEKPVRYQTLIELVRDIFEPATV